MLLTLFMVFHLFMVLKLFKLSKLFMLFTLPKSTVLLQPAAGDIA